MSTSTIVFTTSTQQHLAQVAERKRRRHHADIVDAMAVAVWRAEEREWERDHVGFCTACLTPGVRLNEPIPTASVENGQRNHGYGCEVCS